MRTVIIIHGSYGSPDENWFPWLKKQVRDAGHKAIVPEFPTPDGQNLESWRRTFDAMAGGLTRDNILVGHSLGVAFILDIVERSAQSMCGSFFASGFIGELGNPQFDAVNKSFVCREFDWAKIRENAGRMFLYHGDNDPYVPLSKCWELSSKLHVEPRVIHNGGHLNSAAGYMKFEELWADMSELLKL
jgi:predicted alpha/beta hydrolase family esterase